MLQKLYLVFILLIFSVQLMAQKIDQKFGCKRPLKVGLYEMGMLYSSQTKKGTDKDVAEALEKLTNCKFQYMVLPRARIWQLIETGELDITLSGVVTEEREVFAAFYPYGLGKNHIILDKNLPKVKTLQDVLNLPKDVRVNVGVVRSFSYGKEIDNFIAEAKKRGMVIEFPDLVELASAIEKKRVKVTFASLVVLHDFLKSPTVKENVLIRDLTADMITANLVLSKKNFNKKQQEEWAFVVKKMLGSGEMKRIFQEYFPNLNYQNYAVEI